MKTKTWLILALSALAVSCGVNKGQKNSARTDITGTWKLVQDNLTCDSVVGKIAPEFTKIKQITDGHFSWMIMLASDGLAINGAGGTYQLDGDTYTETIGYGFSRMMRYVGKQGTYKISVRRDTMRISGFLGDDPRIKKEVWVRIGK